MFLIGITSWSDLTVSVEVVKKDLPTLCKFVLKRGHALSNSHKSPMLLSFVLPIFIGTPKTFWPNKNDITFFLLRRYTIELTHGPFKWTIKRRYKHFNSLHQQLSFFRTSLNIPFPSRSHKEKRTTLKATAREMADESTLKDLPSHTKVKQTSTPLRAEGRSSKIAGSNANNAMAIISPNHSSILAGLTPRRIQKKRKKKKKRKLPRFPNRPESLVTVENLSVRIKQLEDYLYNLLNISLYRSHHETVSTILLKCYETCSFNIKLCNSMFSGRL